MLRLRPHPSKELITEPTSESYAPELVQNMEGFTSWQLLENRKGTALHIFRAELEWNKPVPVFQRMVVKRSSSHDGWTKTREPETAKVKYTAASH